MSFGSILNLKLPDTLKKILKLLDVLVKLAYITSDSKSFSLIHFVTGIYYEHSSTDVYERQGPAREDNQNCIDWRTVGGILDSIRCL